MNSPITIAMAPHKMRKQISVFYATVGEYPRFGKTETIFIALEEKRIVGAVRLVVRKTYCVLRTLNVVPDKQRQGIGKSLIKTIITNTPHGFPLYCLPYPHVKSLYTYFEFKEIRPHELPRALQIRYERYKKEFAVIAMKRDYIMGSV